MRSSRTRVEGYRARRPMGAVVMVVILGVAAGLVWFNVLRQVETGCQSTALAAATGTGSSGRLPTDALDAVEPAPPQLTRIQVLNAGGVRGAATIVDAELAQLGFAPTNTPANDPRYPDFNLHCYGEIRFGAAGEAAARTLSLAVPCAALVRDERSDGGVDLALGSRFSSVRPNDAARSALLDLAASSHPADLDGPAQGGLAAQPADPTVHTALPELFRLARQVKC